MYHIQANYEGRKWECIDTFPSKKEASEMLSEYLLAYKGTGQALRMVARCRYCERDNREQKEARA